MAMMLDTHFSRNGAWNRAPIFACRHTVADRGATGYTLALAARCVR